MSFKVLREVKALVVAFNSVKWHEPVEFWFPHMYADGQWSVDLVFCKCPNLIYYSGFLSFALANCPAAFLMDLNGDIALHLQ